MVRFLRLTLLRPFERFLAQCIAISNSPSAFVQERVRLNDTTNFLRAAGFFGFAISSAFLAEVATLYLLGIGNLTEPFYWLVILLTSIPFVLFSFLLVRLVAPLSFRDVLHLSLYPLGAGVFAGAALALVASAVVAALVAVGYIPEIKYDFSQWGEMEQLVAVNKRALSDCLKQESLFYAILAAGLQETYLDLKPPIDSISYLRPIIALLYLVIAARVFMAAVDRRKAAVFSMVLLAALIATGTNFLWLRGYLDWKYENTRCQENLAVRSLDRMAESALAKFARNLETSKEANEIWDASVHAEGRVITYAYRLKKPIVDLGAFQRWVSRRQRDVLEGHCSTDGWFLRSMKATETHTYYSSEGKWVSGFSIGPTNCPQW